MTASLHSTRYSKFRNILKDARKQAGLTQTAVANALDKHQSYVTKYELGERRVDIVELIDIANAIGCDPKDIIDQLLEE